MKVMFDTNIYVGWIRNRSYESVMRERLAQRYLSAVVLEELWAGAETKQAARIVESLQQPYLRSGRVVTLDAQMHIAVGQVLSDLPAKYAGRKREAAFVNDIGIAVTARSIGAVLYTANRSDFTIIDSQLARLRLAFV